jgi:hypothetical protein
MNQNPNLSPTFFIDCDNPSIIEKVDEFIRSDQTMAQRTSLLFQFVRDHIKYSIYAPRTTPLDFQASRTLIRGKGYCVQKAVLFVALNRRAGIPSRLRFAEIKNHSAPPELVAKRGTNVFAYNGYAEVLVHGRWVKAAPMYDRQFCRDRGIPLVVFNGDKDALLPARTLDGRRHVEYLKNHGAYTDLPYDSIKAASLSTKYLDIK